MSESIQTAIDTAPNGGVVTIPPGLWDEDLVITKSITLEGAGRGFLSRTPFRNSTEWDDVINQGLYCGTVLRGHIDATMPTARLCLRNLNMIGHGIGIAVDVGNGVDMYPDALDTDSVLIGNYETAVRIRRSYYLSLYNLTIVGVDTGIQVIDSNVVRISDADIMVCILGADLQGGCISFLNGSIQHSTDGIRFKARIGALGSVWYEDIANVSLDLIGDGNSITPSFYATNSGTIRISGKNNDVTIGINPVLPIELTDTSRYNYVRGSAYLVVNDAGFQNRCETLWTGV